jgi:hypothetical protein
MTPRRDGGGPRSRRLHRRPVNFNASCSLDGAISCWDWRAVPSAWGLALRLGRRQLERSRPAMMAHRILSRSLASISRA